MTKVTHAALALGAALLLPTLALAQNQNNASAQPPQAQPSQQAQPSPAPQAMPTPAPQATPTPAPQATPTPAPQATPTPAPQAIPAAEQKVQQDGHVVIADEGKTEAGELGLLKDQEKAEVSAVNAKNLPSDEHVKQLKEIRRNYHHKRLLVMRKYHDERKETRQEVKKDLKQDAAPAAH